MIYLYKIKHTHTAMDAIFTITIVITGLIIAAVIWQVRQKPFVNIPEPTEAEKNLPIEYYYPELQEPAVAEVIEEPTVKPEVEVEVEVKKPVAAKKTVKKAAPKTAKKSTTRKPKAQ